MNHIKRRSAFQRWESRFDIFIGGVVVLNCLLIGIQIDTDARGISNDFVFEIMEYCFSAIFSFELMIRLNAYGRSLLSGENRYWTLFDTVLVFASWCDVMVSAVVRTEAVAASGAIIRKLIQATKLVRILRLLRLVRFLSRIRVMTSLIFATMGSLFWLFVIFFAMIYVFAIVLTQGATNLAREELVTSNDTLNLHFFWGNVMESMYTLFMSTCSGVSWGEPGVHVRRMGIPYFLLFCFYIFFVYFSVVNIVTGVFVDGAIQKANTDRSLMIENTLTHRKFTEACLRDLMSEIDFNQNGQITKEEWNNALRDDKLWSCMKALGVHADEDLWFILDREGNQHLSVHEIVSSLCRLKGEASAIDMYQVMRKLDALSNKFNSLASSALFKVNSTMSTVREGTLMDSTVLGM